MIEGLGDFRRKVRALAPRARQAARQALASAAASIADDARARAPKRTGKGAGLITSRATASGGRVDERGYLIQQELGTEDTPAQPHLRPAAEVGQETATRAARARIKSVLQ